MSSPRSNTAKQLARLWKLNVRHALYRKTGDWYHQLERFPGALLDAEGYVIFETREAFHACSRLRIKQDVSVLEGGIKLIPGYTRVSDRADVIDPRSSSEKSLVLEGARTDVVQSQLERDLAARAACLRFYGYACIVCGLDFAKRYGPIGKCFIHVHHLKPLAMGERLVDPVVDLRPMCPNCHAMAHRVNPPLPVESLKSLLRAHGA